MASHSPHPRRRRFGRYLPVILGVLLLVGVLGGLKFLQVSKLMAFGQRMQAMGPPPEVVGAAAAQARTWERTLEAVGTVASAGSVVIRNEVPGVVKRIEFNSGGQAKAGALLLELDADIERSQLAAARARRDLAAVALERSRRLFEGGAVTRSQLDEAESARSVAQSEASTLEARLDQKLIRAPFSGRLGIREVSVGQLLDPGTRITVLDAVGGGFVDFLLPQEDAARVSTGTPVRVRLSASREREVQGEVVAVEPTVDRSTRNLRLRARVAETAGEALKPGTFVEVTLVTPEKMEVVVVPATAIIHAPYGDSVFVLEDKKPGTPGADMTPNGRPVLIARQQFVRVGPPRGDFVAILQGLRPGVRVVTQGGFKLRNGAPVVVDESPAPKPNELPTPGNR